MTSGSFTKPFKRRSAEWYFQERQRRRALRMGQDGYPIRVEQIAHQEHLFYCWRKLAAEGGKGAGLDRYTYADFSPSEVGQIVADLSEQVISGAYFAEEVRSVKIRKRPDSTDTRELKIGTLCDRVLGCAINHAFTGFWKKRFLPWSFGFRPKLSTWDMLADVEVAMKKSGRSVLAIDDLKTAFDTVPIATVIELHAQALADIKQRKFTKRDKERTLALITAVLRGHDRTRNRGIDQGAPYSPTALNVLLHHHHDLRIKEISTELLWWRYADNLAYLCRSMDEGTQVLGKVGQFLKPLGMSLKGQDGIKDLSHGDVGSLLGFSLWLEGEILRLEIETNTLNHLRQHLGQSHVTPNPVQHARQVILAWVTAYAPAFEDGDLTDVLDIAAESGFRESFSRHQLQERWKESWERWLGCRRRALLGYRDR